MQVTSDASGKLLLSSAKGRRAASPEKDCGHVMLMVRPVITIDERARQLELLASNLIDFDHQRRHQWAYVDNPAGSAWSWLLYAGADGEPIGTATVFPKFMWLNRRLIRCGQVGDFAIAPAFRSLGPAIQLQRATFQPVDLGEIEMCYDTPPHERGMATFRRIGIESSCSMARHAKLLRCDSWLATRLNNHRITGLCVPVGNALLKMSWPRPNRCEVGPFPGEFDEEFTELDLKIVRSATTLRSRLTASDLNWRYRRNPTQSFDVLVATRKGALGGYVVFRRAGNRAFISLVVGDSDRTRAELLRAAFRRLQRAGVEVVSCQVVSGGTLSALLRKEGLYFRGEAHQVVCYANERSLHRNEIQGSGIWDLQEFDVAA